MWLFVMLVIKPFPGEFRTKIDNLPNEMKAYSLLERNKENTGLNNLSAKSNKLEFIAPRGKKYYAKQATPTHSLLNEIKSKKKLFFNYTHIEIENN